VTHNSKAELPTPTCLPADSFLDVSVRNGLTPCRIADEGGAAGGQGGAGRGQQTTRERVSELVSSDRLLIVPLFRGSSRFESLVFSHHSRFTCECNKKEINDDDDADEGGAEGGRGGAGRGEQTTRALER